MVDYFEQLARKQGHGASQPFVFYIDARWSSLGVMEALQKRNMYGVLSIGENQSPKSLWPWMKNDLAKHDWWSIGNPRLEANLVCIRTKKNAYVKLFTNFASLQVKQYKKRRRKPPTKEYYVKAAQVQIDYNAYKCKVDQFNKAIHEYARIGMPVNEDVTFTQEFIGIYVQQAWTYYNFSATKKISQLEFHERLIEELSEKYSLAKLVRPVAEKKTCWPISKSPLSKKCQYKPCRNMCSTFCEGCDKWGCQACLKKAHT
jgi:hypothetical protein